MRNVSAETHMGLCERKIWFVHALEWKQDFQCESNHNPCNCEPLSKIGRLLTWKLFQELESAVHWSDGYIMLIGFSLWT